MLQKFNKQITNNHFNKVCIHKNTKILRFQNWVKYFWSVRVILFYIEYHHHVSTFQTRQFSTKAKHIRKKKMNTKHNMETK